MNKMGFEESGMSMNQIIIWNDDVKQVELLCNLLLSEGFEVIRVKSEDEVRSVLKERTIHLLLTDVEQKRTDGIQLIREIRGMSSIPIMIFSKNNTETAKIAALNAGADDYVVLPCNPLELVARIKSQIRRYTQLANLCENINRIYRVDDLEVDDLRRKVTVGDREVYLTPIEYKILRLLVKEKGRVLSIDQIYEAIWNMQAIGADNTIAVHIRHIREKIERNPKEPQYLKVVWGTGYKVG